MIRIRLSIMIRIRLSKCTYGKGDCFASNYNGACTHNIIRLYHQSFYHMHYIEQGRHGQETCLLELKGWCVSKHTLM